MQPIVSMYQSNTRTPLLDTKQVLGEHLFAKVSEVHCGKADCITGMLLEAENDDIMRMLEDDSLLRQRIEGALRVIQGEDERSEEKERYGEALYAEVAKMEPLQCAKITGMLLELDAEVIGGLLSSPANLRNAVAKSLASLRSEGSRREELGERLYGLVAGSYDADSAAKITGMLLEMDDAQLSHVIQNKTELEKKIKLAADALSVPNTSTR